jgi:hypothetical protein
LHVDARTKRRHHWRVAGPVPSLPYQQGIDTRTSWLWLDLRISGSILATNSRSSCLTPVQVDIKCFWEINYSWFSLNGRIRQQSTLNTAPQMKRQNAMPQSIQFHPSISMVRCIDPCHAEYGSSNWLKHCSHNLKIDEGKEGRKGIKQNAA